MFVDQEFNYYYGEQLKNYIEQFAQVFSEMYVMTGKNDNNTDNKYIRIPIMYGSPDKVVIAIKNDNTQNKALRIPAFSIRLDQITIMMDRKSGTNTEHRKSVMPVGGDIKKDLKVVKRIKPLPYNLSFSVFAYASNTDQMFQIMEQILLLFDPMLQFQTSDAYMDWAKIVDAEMIDITMENNRNPEDDGRILITSFRFDVRAYLSPPADVKDNAIKSLRMRIEALSEPTDLQKYMKGTEDEHGNPRPEYTVIYDLDKSTIPPI